MRSTTVQVLTASLLVLVPAAAVGTEDVSASFARLCEEWTRNLATRERRNLDDVQWEFSPTGVRGTYIGYTPVRSCALQEPSGSVPIGTMRYLEVRYEKHGWTVPEAEDSPPAARETTGITEIFRHTGGKWQY
jgi:hypothetical protein